MHQSVYIAVSLIVVLFAVQATAQSAGNNTTNNTRAVERPYTGVISVSNGQIWGSWGNREMCPLGTYATGFSLKVESNQGYFGDDTALNAIALRCTAPRTASTSILSYSTVQSSSGSWGSWTQNYWCTTGVMRAFQLRVEPYQGLADDTAANNIRFMCTNGQIMEGNGMSWGSWGSWSSTCPGRGICGIETRVEPPQGILDDTSLNNVRFYCCS